MNRAVLFWFFWAITGMMLAIQTKAASVLIVSIMELMTALLCFDDRR
jgi:hypothetical protein